MFRKDKSSTSILFSDIKRKLEKCGSIGKKKLIKSNTKMEQKLKNNIELEKRSKESILMENGWNFSTMKQRKHSKKKCLIKMVLEIIGYLIFF